MSEELKAKLETRKDELKAEFDKGDELIKGFQKEIAELQRKIAGTRETQVRLQGAYAEVERQLSEPEEE